MEVVERVGGPFSRRNVQEWSRLDQLTGLLEHARVETDHWTASTSNSSHHFGKVVDSRCRNHADGGQEQRQQTKQLEVFQTTVPGGSLQVIRSSTTSSWQSHKTLSSGSGWPNSERLALPSLDKDFDHLKLTLNPLDLSSQKSKASVGRSGSISGRRPPSRPRSIAGAKPEDVSELTAICHRVHEQAKKESDRLSPVSNGFSCDQNEQITNDESSSVTSDSKSLRSTVINDVKKSSSNSTISNSHISLIRKKSCSSEDLHTVSEEGNETDSNGSEWRRSSKVRRSLQFPPKPSSTHKETIVIPVTKSVAEIKREIEARKQLVTNSFKPNQWNNLAELEGVLGVASNGDHDERDAKEELESRDVGTISPTKAKKRQTFITVESLKEVRGRLRKLNSPVEEILKNDDVDDGIDTEVKTASPRPKIPDQSPELSTNSVKSYVYGMEVMLRKTKPPITGTGSLESRSSTKSLTNGNNRSEEWYNRRKSYGFEQVSNQQNNYTSFEKSKIESSTDSGICRSSDTFPSWQKLSEKSNQTSPIKTTHNIIIKPYHDPADSRISDVEGGAVVQKGRKTVVNLTSTTVNTSWPWNSNNDESRSLKDRDKEVLPKGKIADAIRSLHEKSNSDNTRLSEPITISIPIQQTTKTSHTDPSNLLLKQTKTSVDKTETTSHPKNGITPYSELLFGKESGEEPGPEMKSLFDNIPWRGGRTKTLSNFFDSEFKRHSIAVDQTKYLSNKKSFGSFNFNGIHDTNKRETDNTSTIVPFTNDKDQHKDSTDSDHESSGHEKKQKKVEFCKTEVHFAAEPGRFNIVETDGKPPPTNLYRRRRKTTSDVPIKSGLPEIRFGDTPFEKNMLSTNESAVCSEVSSETQTYGRPLLQDNESNANCSNSTVMQSKPFSTALAQVDHNVHTLETQPNHDDDSPKPRSILKNNIPKPKPYLLGESPDTQSSEDNSSWGVRLKSVKSDDENSRWQSDSLLPKETEFQKLLKSLRPAASKPPDLFEIPSQVEQSSTAADNGLEVRIMSSALMPDHRRASWSVADRVRHSEEARGYSTKVNFGPQETTVVDSDKSSSRFSTSEGLKSSWLIKEHNSSFDIKTAAQEPCLKANKRLAHSQSFSASASQNQGEQSRDVYEGNTLKSTSLVMEVQNPIVNHASEKKVSVKEISTNLTRDNCGRNFYKAREQSSKSSLSVSEKIHQYSRGVMATEKEKSKIYHENTKTVPPIRKTSSSTQTYFVNRSTVKRDSRQELSSKTNQQQKLLNPSEKLLDDINGLPSVLNALDDLSRCIDEVIIEYPQKVCKKENDNIFKVKEDYKTNINLQNIMSMSSDKSKVRNQLDLLREIIDSGELSEDSLKADEEVRAYMSTDNDDDALSSEWSGSWSRMRTQKQNLRDAAKIDLVPRISPSFGSGPHQRQGTEASSSTSSEAPKVTSICLRYNDSRPANISTTAVRPAAIYKASEVNHPVSSFVSRSLLNSESSGICSKVELSSNGERTWSFSKMLATEPLKGDSDYLGSNHLMLEEKEKNKLFTKDLATSPSRFSRNSQSPSKESLFLERTAERNILYNESNRQMSSSPTSGTSGKTASSKVIKEECNVKKSDKVNYPSKSFITQSTKSSAQGISSNINKSRVEDKAEIRKSDIKKSNGEVKVRERKLSVSSSGRDSWLNTPKEVQVRKKHEPSFRKPDIKKENKTGERSFKTSSAKATLKRTESPIYQNREIYAERRDSNDNTETESTILEELTKAADQILLAVNGYTDDDSFRASSDDEFRKRRDKVTSQPLCTISELPTKKTNNNRQSTAIIRSTRSTDLRKECRSSSKTRIGKTSSNSSMESADSKPLLSAEDRSKRRAARLLQRASSRELLFTTASSSEDIGSGSDTGSLRAKRVFRRPRLQNGKHGSKQDLTASPAESRAKERTQRPSELRSNEVHKAQKLKTQPENRCSRHSKSVTGPTSSDRKERERRIQTSVSQVSRSQKKRQETSQLEVKCG